MIIFQVLISHFKIRAMIYRIVCRVWNLISIEKSILCYKNVIAFWTKSNSMKKHTHNFRIVMTILDFSYRSLNKWHWFCNSKVPFSTWIWIIRESNPRPYTSIRMIVGIEPTPMYLNTKYQGIEPATTHQNMNNLGVRTYDHDINTISRGMEPTTHTVYECDHTLSKYVRMYDGYHTSTNCKFHEPNHAGNAWVHSYCVSVWSYNVKLCKNVWWLSYINQLYMIAVIQYMYLVVCDCWYEWDHTKHHLEMHEFNLEIRAISSWNVDARYELW